MPLTGRCGVLLPCSAMPVALLMARNAVAQLFDIKRRSRQA